MLLVYLLAEIEVQFLSIQEEERLERERLEAEARAKKLEEDKQRKVICLIIQDILCCIHVVNLCFVKCGVVHCSLWPIQTINFLCTQRVIFIQQWADTLL